MWMERGSTCIASRWWQRLRTLVGCWRRANQTGEGAAYTVTACDMPAADCLVKRLLRAHPPHSDDESAPHNSSRPERPRKPIVTLEHFPGGPAVFEVS